MGLTITVRVVDTEIPEFGSVGYAVGDGPDGSTVRFYADLTIVRDLRDRIEGGEVPEITVPADQFVLSADHWTCLLGSRTLITPATCGFARPRRRSDRCESPSLRPE